MDDLEEVDYYINCFHCRSFGGICSSIWKCIWDGKGHGGWYKTMTKLPVNLTLLISNTKLGLICKNKYFKYQLLNFGYKKVDEISATGFYNNSIWRFKDPDHGMIKYICGTIFSGTEKKKESEREREREKKVRPRERIKRRATLGMLIWLLAFGGTKMAKWEWAHLKLCWDTWTIFHEKSVRGWQHGGALSHSLGLIHKRENKFWCKFIRIRNLVDFN